MNKTFKELYTLHDLSCARTLMIRIGTLQREARHLKEFVKEKEEKITKVSVIIEGEAFRTEVYNRESEESEALDIGESLVGVIIEQIEWDIVEAKSVLVMMGFGKWEEKEIKSEG